MNARLTQVQISDFRSIRGKITVPLDAPVVLVHGPNGSGKTSLLSAIELGLTGAVSSLQRYDAAYAENLVHLDAQSGKASVIVSAEHDEIPAKPSELVVENGNIRGMPLLSELQSRFFSERSLLAQATLGRLLEIYEESDARKSTSPLTRFVNDLLGLDQLDALVDGLHASGDKRRLVKSLPLYGEVSDELADHDEKVNRLEEAVTTSKERLTESQAALEQALEPFGLKSVDQVGEDRSGLGDAEAERRRSVETNALRREIEAALSLWRRLEQQPGAEARSTAESELRAHQAELDAWATSKRAALEAALAAAASLYADLSPARSVGWSASHAEAVRELSELLSKTEAHLARDENARKELTDFRETLTKARAREARLDESLGALAANSGNLAQALSELAPLVDSEICPVCQRDFSETGPTPLRAHLATHIASLSQSASKLRSVADERQTVRNEITKHEQSLNRLQETVLVDDELTSLRNWRASLSDTVRQLKETEGAANEGDALAAAVASASERLAKLRSDEESLIGVWRSVAGFAAQLGLKPPAESDDIGVVLETYLAAADQSLETATCREQDRRKAEEALEQHSISLARLGDLESDLKSARADQKRVKDAVKSADDVRAEIRKLSDRAVEARTSVVRDVFNESLNKVWSNLFARLAPEEPFLPAFELPDKGKGPVEAKLITRYRGDDRGGNPKAMLSAGNLNTAALTLFLSLHLSVKPLLPWLVIDDPVQSMDEIHIAQFAALLRTLSKQRGRQVIIAVHERPLFEYLSLELSPASPGDKLITVELSKDSEGHTICSPEPIIWDSSTVFRAQA